MFPALCVLVLMLTFFSLVLRSLEIVCKLNHKDLLRSQHGVTPDDDELRSDPEQPFQQATIRARGPKRKTRLVKFLGDQFALVQALVWLTVGVHIMRIHFTLFQVRHFLLSLEGY